MPNYIYRKKNYRFQKDLAQDLGLTGRGLRYRLEKGDPEIRVVGNFVRRKNDNRQSVIKSKSKGFRTTKVRGLDADSEEYRMIRWALPNTNALPFLTRDRAYSFTRCLTPTALKETIDYLRKTFPLEPWNLPPSRSKHGRYVRKGPKKLNRKSRLPWLSNRELSGESTLLW